MIGTTDVPASHAEIEPSHEASEIDFLLDTINPFLRNPIGVGDIFSVFSGLRPLITGGASQTYKLSREHSIDASAAA